MRCHHYVCELHRGGKLPQATQLCKLARSVTDRYKGEAPAKSKKSQLTQKSAEGFAGQLKIDKGVRVIVDLFTNPAWGTWRPPHTRRRRRSWPRLL